MNNNNKNTSNEVNFLERLKNAGISENEIEQYFLNKNSKNSDEISFFACVDTYLNKLTNKKTEKDYNYNFQKLKRDLPNLKITDFKTLNEYILNLKNTDGTELKNSSKNSWFAFIRAYLRVCSRTLKIDLYFDLENYFKTLPVNYEGRIAWNDEDIKKIESVIDKYFSTEKMKWFKTCFKLLLINACRSGEYAKIKFNFYENGSGWLFDSENEIFFKNIETEKGGNPRIFIVPKELSKTAEHRSKYTIRELFNELQRYVKKEYPEFSNRKIVSHMCRTTTITNLVIQGKNANDIATKLTGHKKTDTIINHYVKVDPYQKINFYKENNLIKRYL